MYAEIGLRDADGTPLQVNTDNGFIQCSRPYVAEEDGWIEDQLDTDDFPAIQAGRQMEQLVNLANALKRDNFRLKQEVKMWQKASGIGTSHFHEELAMWAKSPGMLGK